MKRYALAAMLAATPAAAQLETMQLAVELGSVLGSESFCGLTYKQDRIAAFIAEKAPANDMGFAPNLAMMTQGADFQNQSMTPSAKTAHCAAITQTARHFGFID